MYMYLEFDDLFVWVVFYGPVNPMGSCRARSVDKSGIISPVLHKNVFCGYSLEAPP